jgi:ABC-type branched-subunit amino acid transport system permease subunit
MTQPLMVLLASICLVGAYAVALLAIWSAVFWSGRYRFWWVITAAGILGALVATFVLFTALLPLVDHASHGAH